MIYNIHAHTYKAAAALLTAGSAHKGKKWGVDDDGSAGRQETFDAYMYHLYVLYRIVFVTNVT